MPKSKWKPPSDPWGDLEIELCQLKTLSWMIVRLDAREDREELDYLTERLPEHMSRATKLFYTIHTMWVDVRPKPPEPPPPPPLSMKEKRAMVETLRRSLGMGEP